MLKIIESIRNRILAPFDLSDTSDILCERKFVRKEKVESGIPKEAWSPENQQRLAVGKKPVGHPEHPNV